MVVATLVTNKLFEDPDAIVIIVSVSFVTKLQERAIAFIIHEVDEEKLGAWIKFLLVYIFKDEPAYVVNVGVTVNVIKLYGEAVALIIDESLYVYPAFPLRRVTNSSPTTVSIVGAFPLIIEFDIYAY